MADSPTSALRFVPFEKLDGQPNIIVDGAPHADTVLTLSHWPNNNTPEELKRDSSTEIVFAYLDAPEFHHDVEVVSNNHFDEDGLLGLFVLLEPRIAETHRELLIDAAMVGDFGVYRDREAARIAFVLGAFSEASSSPLPQKIFALPYADQVAALYENLLPLLPRLLNHVGEYREYWEREDAHLSQSEELIDRGTITIEEISDVDLAVVRIPEEIEAHHARRFSNSFQAACHPLAIHGRTSCNRLLLIWGQRIEMQYRYESWVQFVSAPPPLRVDLSEFCAELNDRESGGGRWVFDGVGEITPALHVQDSAASSIPIDWLLPALCAALKRAAPTWNPYE